MRSLSLAVRYASKIHASQVRKGTSIPYISHLLQVSGLVLEFGGTEKEAVAGLLHDGAEDAGGEAVLDYIESEFGWDVADIVRQNSDSITDDPEVKAPWRERKESYLKGIAHKSDSALLVSICDKIHNARSLGADSRSLGESHWSRFNAPKADLLWYYQSLAAEFEKRLDEFPRLKPAAAEFRHAVEELISS